MGFIQQARTIAQRIDHNRAIRNDYRLVFDTDAGRRVLAHLAREAGMYDDRIAPTARESDLLLGERRLFLRLLKLIRMTDEELDALVLNRGNDAA